MSDAEQQTDGAAVGEAAVKCHDERVVDGGEDCGWSFDMPAMLERLSGEGYTVATVDGVSELLVCLGLKGESASTYQANRSRWSVAACLDASGVEAHIHWEPRERRAAPAGVVREDGERERERREQRRDEPRDGAEAAARRLAAPASEELTPSAKRPRYDAGRSFVPEWRRNVGGAVHTGGTA